MKAFKKFLWGLSLTVAVAFASVFSACADILGSFGASSTEPDAEKPVGITAVYEQSSQVFVSTPLDDLKKDLKVFLVFDEEESEQSSEESAEESSQDISPKTSDEVETTDDYTLSGTLVVGESEITVTYTPDTTLTATFTVLVSEESEGGTHTHVFTNYISDNNATCTADGT